MTEDVKPQIPSPAVPALESLQAAAQQLSLGLTSKLSMTVAELARDPAVKDLGDMWLQHRREMAGFVGYLAGRASAQGDRSFITLDLRRPK